MLVHSDYDITRDIFSAVRDLWHRAYWALHPESTRRPVPRISTRDAFLIASFVSDYDQEDYRYDPKTDSVVTRWETEDNDYNGPDIDSLPVIDYDQMPHPDWYSI